METNLSLQELFETALWLTRQPVKQYQGDCWSDQIRVDDELWLFTMFVPAKSKVLIHRPVFLLRINLSAGGSSQGNPFTDVYLVLCSLYITIVGKYQRG